MSLMVARFWFELNRKEFPIPCGYFKGVSGMTCQPFFSKQMGRHLLEALKVAINLEEEEIAAVESALEASPLPDKAGLPDELVMRCVSKISINIVKKMLAEQLGRAAGEDEDGAEDEADEPHADEPSTVH